MGLKLQKRCEQPRGQRVGGRHHFLKNSPRFYRSLFASDGASDCAPGSVVYAVTYSVAYSVDYSARY